MAAGLLLGVDGAFAPQRSSIVKVLPLIGRSLIVDRPTSRFRLNRIRVQCSVNCLRAGAAWTRPAASPSTELSIESFRLAHQHFALPNVDRNCGLRQRRKVGRCKALRLDNRELLIGDCVSLVCFALYKQITALIFMPSFPGWTAPLAFNPMRFLEFVSFAVTLMASWTVASLLVGGYRINATADMPTALQRTCAAWLISMPIAACQLVITTAVEDQAFVTDPHFAVALPLAASGPGEPLVTAAGVLGVMCMWRTFYTAYLDFWNNSTIGGSPIDRYQDSTKFVEALRAAALLSIAGCVVLRYMGDIVGEEQIQTWLASLPSTLPSL